MPEVSSSRLILVTAKPYRSSSVCIVSFWHTARHVNTDEWILCARNPSYQYIRFVSDCGAEKDRRRFLGLPFFAGPV